MENILQLAGDGIDCATGQKGELKVHNAVQCALDTSVRKAVL